MEGDMGEVIEELPKTIVRRVVKKKLSECSDAGDIDIHKDALLAFSVGARVFIQHLSAKAYDLCEESKRQTIDADDVLKAIEEIDFPQFLGPLRASIEDYRQTNSEKPEGAAKLRQEEDRVVEGNEDENNADDQKMINDADKEPK